MYKKPILAGIFGSVGLLVIYTGIMFIATRNMSYVFSQFFSFKYWIIGLALGFGIQMGLFFYIRSGMHLSSGSLATSAGTSTFAMVACCLHHVVDFLPILGLSSAALFLSRYQTYFFLLGIVSNLLGIAWMISIIKLKRCPNLFWFIKKR